jgi:hypothetical protein
MLPKVFPKLEKDFGMRKDPTMASSNNVLSLPKGKCAPSWWMSGM